MANDPTIDIEELAARLPAKGALIGLDPGTKTIGVALSDATRLVANPLETIRRTKFKEDAARLAQLVGDHAVKGIIVGLPLNMDGSAGPRAQSVRAFVRNLSALFDVPISYWDERLSSVAAERVLLEADTSRRRRAEVIDKMAASIILQGALDRMGRL